MLSESTVQGAASTAGVNEKTLRRWMADDERFRSELAEARHNWFDAAMNRVQALASTAVDTLAVRMGPKAPLSVRLTDARTLLELGIHRQDGETLLRRLEDVEADLRQYEAAAKESKVGS